MAKLTRYIVLGRFTHPNKSEQENQTTVWLNPLCEHSEPLFPEELKYMHRHTLHMLKFSSISKASNTMIHL